MKNYLTKEQKLEILMDCRCTRKEAVNYVDKNDVTFYTADELLADLDSYVFEDDNEEYKQYIEMIKTKKALPDWNVVDYNGTTYFIGFCL